MPSPIEQYHNDQQQSGFSADISQANAIERLQRLYVDLCTPERGQSRPIQWPQRITAWVGGKPKKEMAAKGLYFWGGVGRGKPYLMDVFTNAYRLKASSAPTSTVLCAMFIAV